ncbi:MAG TPA: phosphate ABC transporter permease subunit PstC [Actinomycetota bacterium]
MSTTTGDPGLSIKKLQGSPRRKRKEAFVRGILFTAAGISLVVSVAIVLALIGQTVNFLTKIDLSQLWTSGWFPRDGEYDIPTILIGTVEVSVIAMVIAAPLGLGAAMYLSEYASPRTRRRLKPILETLAGIPSVVLGYFALQVINPNIVQDLMGATPTFTIMAAGIAVGILIIPLVASVAEDAMYAVPNALREAAYGIGARRRTVTIKVVFPAAVSGIMASLILGFSRALGETMIVAIAAGASGGAIRHWNPLEPGQTMTGAISSLAIGSDQVKSSSASEANPFDALYFVGLLLFVMTLAMNMLSERFVRRVRKEY